MTAWNKNIAGTTRAGIRPLLLQRTAALLSILVFLATVLLITVDANALTPKEQYYKAKKKYDQLLKNKAHQKRRDKWLACIESFETVYKLDPNGPWAAAGMYRSAELYHELYKRSGKNAYRSEALDRFERIIKRYPKSRYKGQSRKAIAAIKSKPKSTSAPSAKKLQEKKYLQADACYSRLRKSPGKQKYRDQWETCIDKYDAAYKTDMGGPYAAASLYQTGELYHGLYRWSHIRADREKATNRLQNTIERYPDSSYAQKAESKLIVMHGKNSPVLKGLEKKEASTGLYIDQSDDISKMIQDSAGTRNTAGKLPPAADGHMTIVQGLRSWSNPGYTRIVIDADRKTRYKHHILKRDPSNKKPPRMYVDLMNSRLKKGIDTSVPINDNLLSKVRAGQNQPDSVRVVIDIKSYKYYKIFNLSNPFRIVIDVRGEDQAMAKGGNSIPVQGGTKGPIGPNALAKQLALGVKTIVIDPGHGGKDYGAPGYYKGVHEKRIVLDISKKLKKKIEQELNCTVYLTRSTDRYLSLEERTAIANTKNADLFISIHTNSAKDRRAYGIETYFLNLATDDEAIRVAALENQTSTKNISDLETILNDLMQNAKIHESKGLATSVQVSLNSHMRRSYNRIKNKGVKQAPFYVLLGAQMPAILVETSFISNPRECKRLTTEQYQNHLCDGIIKGIRKYIKEINPTALLRNNAATGSSG
jgi:N-acetylmuramoyl-L-alanine amidase